MGFKLYRWLRGRCARRGYSNEISVRHRGFCSGRGTFSGRRGHGSLFCDGETSITYSRRPSCLQPAPACPSRSLPGGYPCGSDGSVVISGGDTGGTSGWGITVGTTPVYGSGYGSEDSGTTIVGSSGGGAGSSCYSGSSAVGGGHGYSYGYDYGYEESPRERVSTTRGGSGGPGYYGGGSGYGLGAGSGPEFSPAGAGSCQAMQQKCPVVVPSIKSQQTKQSSQWPPSQKK
ncbi:keratin, type I cytoskeletal 9-like [Indicator indicator]|uniref:keratin, type I cytoskeletal 9-like n=1 Tax=Indicator indicator TaxID=1002788 RepID=UPI0023DFB805|nr:keratin, type I cytoskeletal 9-like [Indicator indicator]